MDTTMQWYKTMLWRLVKPARRRLLLALLTHVRNTTTQGTSPATPSRSSWRHTTSVSHSYNIHPQNGTVAVFVVLSIRTGLDGFSQLEVERCENDARGSNQAERTKQTDARRSRRQITVAFHLISITRESTEAAKTHENPESQCIQEKGKLIWQYIHSVWKKINENQRLSPNTDIRHSCRLLNRFRGAKGKVSTWSKHFQWEQHSSVFSECSDCELQARLLARESQNWRKWRNCDLLAALHRD